MRLYKSLIVIALVISGIGCNKKESDGKVRPIEHWVFRSVLDWNPRVITLALSDQMWVSYHAASGAMYKAWRGSVYFDGAVYTTAHGPQPISIGNSYVENKYKNPWFVLSGKDTISTIYDYKGHRFVNGRAQLMHSLTSEKFKTPFLIYEEVETSNTSSGSPILERTFTTENVSEGMKVGLKTNVNSIVVESNISTDGEFLILAKEDIKYDEVNTMNIDAVLMLNSNKTTKYHTTFISTPTIENKNIAGGDDAEKEENPSGELPEGLKLIAKSDCKTCHNKTLQTIGPSYTAISQKYKNTPENVSLLSIKIKNGGSGVWGEQAMTPHPDLADEVITEMVSYIMTLDKDTEGDVIDEKGASLVTMNPDTSIKDKNLLPGSIVKIYDIPQNTQLMPSIRPNQKPKQAGILPKFDNLSGGDFKELEENFALVGSGYLKIDTTGTYTFHIWSDDGSLLYINDKEVINNDGSHGAEYGEVSISMTPGYYSFRLDYFQGGGGRFLSFNWKKPGAKDFEVVPNFNIYHKNDQQDLLRDY